MRSVLLPLQLCACALIVLLQVGVIDGAPPVLGNQSTQTFVLQGVTVQPIFSPDNSLDQFVKLLNSATSTLEVTNQHITKFCGQPWATDCSPVMAGIIAARTRGVTVRVMLNQVEDTDEAAPYLVSMGASVCYITSNLYNHNKGVIVDGTTVSVSSVNWSKQALTENRESGAIVYNAAVAGYFLTMFNYDFINSCMLQNATLATLPSSVTIPSYTTTGPQHAPITGDVNITTFVNPDNAYAFNMLLANINSVQSNLHVTMYQQTTTTIMKPVEKILTTHPTADMQRSLHRPEHSP